MQRNIQQFESNHYDLVINAEFIDIEELLDVAIKAMYGKFEKLKHLNQGQKY